MANAITKKRYKLKTTKMEATLSHREFQMVELTALGLAQKEIATKLQLSIHTVDVTIRHAKEKLHLQKSTEIAAWYFISRYHVVLNLTPEVRKMVSLAFVALVGFGIFGGYQPERAFRAQRSRRHHEIELFTL